MPATSRYTTLGLVAAVLALLGAPAAEAGNQRPIIGIMAQPKETDFCTGDKCQYIAASYVKFVESHGGRAMPISYYSTDEEVEEMMQNVNGVLIPGGGSAVPDAMYKIYSLAKEMNEAGDYFPLWGTCMGFEWLVMVSVHAWTLVYGCGCGGYCAELHGYLVVHVHRCGVGCWRGPRLRVRQRERLAAPDLHGRRQGFEALERPLLGPVRGAAGEQHVGLQQPQGGHHSG